MGRVNKISFKNTSSQHKPMYSIPYNGEGMIAPGNIDLANRPTVQLPDGSVATVRSMGVNIKGKEYLIPTVSQDGRLLNNDEAIQEFLRTGQHLGIFDTPEHSTAYAEALHNQQDQMYVKPRERGGV